MPHIEVKLTHKDMSGCHPALFSWKKGDAKVTAHPHSVSKVKDGEYLLKSQASLPKGTYHLRIDLKTSGNKAEAEVIGKPKILLPVRASWPMKIEVPSTRTYSDATWVFEI